MPSTPESEETPKENAKMATAAKPDDGETCDRLLSALMRECSTSDAGWEWEEHPDGLKIYMSPEMLGWLAWLTRGWDGDV